MRSALTSRRTFTATVAGCAAHVLATAQSPAESQLGSLYPAVQAIAGSSPLSLSFLRPEFRDLNPRILRYLRVLEPAEAEDLASDTWLDVATGLHRFEGDEQGFRAWAFTIARRRLIDHRRKRASRSTVPSEPESLVGHHPVGNVEDEAMTGLATQSALERIAALTPDQAEVILLRVLGDLSVEDVARIMGKRPGTVRVIQHRALRKLTQTVSEQAVTG